MKREDMIEGFQVAVATIAVTGLMAMITLTGCQTGTAGTNTTEVTTNVVTGVTPAEVANDVCAIAQAVVPAGVNLAVNYAVKDATNRTAKLVQIHQIAVSIQQAAASGHTSPADLVAACKCDDVYIRTAISAALGFYGYYYPTLVKDPTGKAAVQVVDCIAGYVASATPAALKRLGVTAPKY